MKISKNFDLPLDSIFLPSGLGSTLAEEFKRRALTEIRDGRFCIAHTRAIAIIAAIRANKGLRPLNRAELNLLLDSSEFDEYMIERFEVYNPVASIPSQSPLNGSRFYMAKPSLIHQKPLWEAIRTILERTGSQITAIQPSDMYGREVWVRDFGVKIGGHYFTPDGRYGDSWGYAKRLKLAAKIDYCVGRFRQAPGNEHLSVHQIPDCFFEGGNVIVDEKTRTVILGHNHTLPNGNSADNLIRYVNDVLGSDYRLIVAWLTYPDDPDGYAYHLDIAMSDPLPNGEILVNPRSIRPDSLNLIQQRIGKDRFIQISDHDASVMLATNLVCSGSSLVMTGCSANLRQRLEALGYEIIVPINDPGFTKKIGGGGIRCATQPLPSLDVSCLSL